MNPDILLAVLQVAAGGTIVQLIVYLLRRRSEIKTADAVAKKDEATGDSALLAGATAYAAQLQADMTGRRTIEDKLNARIDDCEQKLDDNQEKARRDAEIARTEIGRLAAQVAQLSVDLTIANGQVERLRMELEEARGRHHL